MLDVTVRSEFAAGGRIWLVDNVFDTDLVQQINSVFVDAENNPAWQSIPEFAHRPGRLVYRGIDSVTANIDAWARANIDRIGDIFGKPVKFLNFDLWYDTPGYAVPNHRDGSQNRFALQVYMGKPTQTWQMLGTCFNRENNNPLFEAHYMTNTGYMIDRPDLVWHSVNHSIPEQYRRMHVYFRFDPV